MLNKGRPKAEHWGTRKRIFFQSTLKEPTFVFNLRAS